MEFNYPVELEGFTPFQKAVWSAMREIPYGQTRSYRWIAEKVGKPRACRAVGNACGKNPLLIIHPCHRVVGSHGKLGGFSAGLDLKKALLGLEGVGSGVRGQWSGHANPKSEILNPIPSACKMNKSASSQVNTDERLSRQLPQQAPISEDKLYPRRRRGKTMVGVVKSCAPFR